jgi:hypothetical protein
VNLSSISAGPVTQEMIDNLGCIGIPLDSNSMVVAGELTDPTAFHCELTGVTSVDYTIYNQIEVNGSFLITDYFPLVADSAECSVACATDSSTTTGCYKVYAPCTADGWSDPNYAIAIPRSGIPNGSDYPGPTLVSSTPGSPGTYSLNYRNEPLPFRVDANVATTDVAANPDQNALDLSYAFSSIERLDDALNQQPTGDPINPADPAGFKFPANQLNSNVSDYDPYTPLMNAYAGDKIQVRTLVGSQNNFHSFQLQGAKWFFEPSYTNSGYKAQQGMGISEHFEMLFDLPSSTNNAYGFSDYLYQPSSAVSGDTNGIWGLLRAYTTDPGAPGGGPPLSNNQASLLKLPNNQEPPSGDDPISERWQQVINTFNSPPLPFKSGLSIANYRTYDVVAITAAEAYQSTLGITVNSRGQVATEDPVTFEPNSELQNPYGLIYVLKQDLEAVETEEDLMHVLRAGLNQEPLILRANAGDYIRINLENHYKPEMLCQIAYDTYDELAAAADALDNKMINDLGCIPSAMDVTTVVSGCAWLVTDDNGTDYTIIRKANVDNGGTTSWVMEVWDPSSPLSWVAAAGTPFSKNTPDVCLTSSPEVGFNPQLLTYDMGTSNGFNSGFNNNQTIGYGGVTSYYWYAGNMEIDEYGELVETPVELGTINLRAADSLVGHTNGLYAAMIVEPEGTTWVEDAGSRASATIFSKAQPSGLDAFLGLPQHGDVLFREFVLLYQEDLNQWQGAPASGSYYSPDTTGGFPFNYKSEPQSYRYASGSTSSVYNWQSNTAVDGDPQTPVFQAAGGLPTRVRLLNINGGCPQVIQLNGHSWQEEPWVNDSTEIGNNPLSQQLGSIQMMANEPFNMVLASAGGVDAVEGDYLLHAWLLDTDGGWGFMRVADAQVVIGSANYRAGRLTVTGWAVDDQHAPGPVTLIAYDANGTETTLGTVEPNNNGIWYISVRPSMLPTSIRATLADGTAADAAVALGARSGSQTESGDPGGSSSAGEE